MQVLHANTSISSFQIASHTEMKDHFDIFGHIEQLQCFCLFTFRQVKQTLVAARVAGV